MVYTNGDTNGHSVEQGMTPGKRLRQLLDNKQNIIIAPGVYDGYSARIALEVGFDCIYMVRDETRAVPHAYADLMLPSDWSRDLRFETRPT